MNSVGLDDVSWFITAAVVALFLRGLLGVGVVGMGVGAAVVLALWYLNRRLSGASPPRGAKCGEWHGEEGAEEGTDKEVEGG